MSVAGERVLGRLERVDLRAAWPGEATHFTPWLAQPDNIALLGEAIGTQLEVQAQEKYVGPFRADILCKDFRDNYVLIENQLERTDHVHMGQLVTYAAGLKAVTVVWVAKEFTDEHRAALDWLNNSTGEGLNFFGLEIELWRIGNSPMAPKFNIVSKPNDWTRVVGEQARGGLTQAQRLHFEFWTQFGQYLEDRRSPIRMGRPSDKAIGNVTLGRRTFRLMPWNLVRDNLSGVWLRFTEPGAKARYALVEQRYRPQVEETLSALGTLRWNPESVGGTISLERPSTLTKPETWQEQNEWMARALETMYALFGEIVARLDAEGVVLDPLPDAEVELVDGDRGPEE